MLDGVRSTSGHERPVNAAHVFRVGEPAHGVGCRDGARFQVAPGPGGDLLATRPTYTARTPSHRPVFITELQDGHERRLARRASHGFPPRGAARPASFGTWELEQWHSPGRPTGDGEAEH